LIAAAVGAAGVGTGVVESVKSSDQNAADQQAQKTALAQQQQAQANQANLSKQEAVLGASGQAQQQTGGSLTDSGTTALTDLLAGYPGFQGGAGSGASGTATSTSAGTGTNASSSSSTNTAGGTPDIAAILAMLRGGQPGGAGGPGGSPTSSISGGNWQTQPAQPQTQFELANPLV
jgi:hypothetical protein